MKILIIDSDQYLCNDLKSILTKKKCSVECYFDGLDAEDILNSNDFDLIIMDINLPKKDGIKLIKDFRKNNQTCPIIVLSTTKDVKIKVETLESGADDYMVKPFDMEEMLARLRVLLRRQFVKYGPIFKFGNTTLDRNNCTVYTEYGTEKLINKEIQILEFLMKNAKEIVPAETIINNAWTSDSYSIDNNLWVFLSFLRKKLKNINSNIIIKNHRNLGYRLEIDNKKQ